MKCLLRPFPCHICNKTFSQKGAVNKHVLIVHEGKIPSFQCETCGKNFTAKAKLKSHVLTVHEGVKPYKCELCSSAFNDFSGHRQHMMRTHGVKFTCDICGKDSSSMAGLGIHKRDAHGIVIY